VEETRTDDGAPRIEVKEEIASETAAVAESPPFAAPPGRTARAATAVAGQMEDLFAAVRRLEAFASEEAKRVSGKLVPQVESKAKQNIWVSLLIALGLGLILGIWLTGGRRRD
jgi:hypothetical protein